MNQTDDKPKKVFFLGIGGTGMASVAGLAQASGFDVSGSDGKIYPPMSTMLSELKIPTYSGYSPDNLKKAAPDLVVVANALSRGNDELEFMLASEMPYTSFPAFLGSHFLNQKQAVVVTGTHGKTTTTSLLAFILKELGEDPSYMIGGIPRDFPKSFHNGDGKTFVIEGDEYDTAFFDKNSKFLHYNPKFLILNNLEFDHADIFSNLEEIEAQFKRLLDLVENNDQIIANVDDPGIKKLIKDCGIENEVTAVSTKGLTQNADIIVSSFAPIEGMIPLTWKVSFETKQWGNIALETNLGGEHNIANLAQILGCISRLAKKGVIKNCTFEQIAAAVAKFQGVQRRMDHLGNIEGIDIFEDFAHHPTAVDLVIKSFKKAFPNRTLHVAFEPKNATSRRNIFSDRYVEAFSNADHVYLGECPRDKRIADEQKMDTQALADKIGSFAKAFAANEDLLQDLVSCVQKGDAIIFMSCGSFSGIQHKMANALKNQSA